MVTLTQMSGFGGAGLKSGGVLSWNVLPCGPADFVGGGECMCALLQSAGKASVEVNTASGPYINHHMSFSLKKMYSMLCLPWIPNGNKWVWAFFGLLISSNSFRPDVSVTQDNLIQPAYLLFFVIDKNTIHSDRVDIPLFYCPRCVNAPCKRRNVICWCRLPAFQMTHFTSVIASVTLYITFNLQMQNDNEPSLEFRKMWHLQIPT